MLSLPHLVIIFLVALVVLGPEKLPEVARVLGKLMAQFRRVTSDFRSQIEHEMRDFDRHARMTQTEDYEPSLAGPQEAPPLPPGVPPSGVCDPIDPVETPVAVPSTAPAAPEKSPDGDSHPA
jgi:Tat protein translocase TatB subunit